MRSTLFLLIVWAFPISEGLLAASKRSRRGSATREDKGSLWVLWGAIGLGVAAAFICLEVRTFQLPWPALAVQSVAIVILLAGMAFRWWAILTLGRMFTVDVSIRHDHALVESGPYRVLRHPSYTGLLVAFTGLGFYFVNALSLVALLAPITIAVLVRITAEEQALRRGLGAAYEDYCARTYRLIPGLY